MLVRRPANRVNRHFNRFVAIALVLASILIGSSGQSAAAASVSAFHAAKSYESGALLVKLRTSASPLAVAQSVGAPRYRALAVKDVYKLHVPPGQERTQLARLQHDPNVLYAQLNYRRQVTDWPASNPNRLATSVVTPNDPDYAAQWALPDIQAPTAWSITTGSAAIPIGIVDTGVYTGHEDLQGKVSLGQSFIYWFDGFAPSQGYGSLQADYSAGGTIPAGTYDVGVTAQNANGELALTSDYVSVVTLSQTGAIALTWNASLDATSYKVYLGTDPNNLHYSGVTTSAAQATLLNPPDSTQPAPPSTSSVVLNPANVNDDFHHGTSVAGVAAALTNNGLGVAGLDWNAPLIVAKVLDRTGGGYDDAIANGIIWAAQHGARVINLSLAGPGPAPTIDDAAKQVRQTYGTVLVAAAGNAGTSPVEYPAAYASEFIAVGALQQGSSGDVRAGYSSYGTGLAVTAPGSSIEVPIAGAGPSSYGYENGTSFAAPLTSGLAALILSLNPSLTPDQVTQIIENSADQIGGGSYGTGGPNPAVTTGWNQYYGYGRINAARAVEAASPFTPTPTPSQTGTPTATPSRLPTAADTGTPSATATPTPLSLGSRTPASVLFFPRVFGHGASGTGW